VERWIGTGQFAEVYEVKDAENNGRVVCHHAKHLHVK